MKKKTNTYNLQIEKEEESNKTLFFQIIKGVEFELQSEIMLDKISSDSILDRVNKVFFLFSGINCKQCILKHLMDINLLADEIGKDRIVFVGDFDNQQLFDEYLYEINFGYNSIVLKDLVFDGSYIV